MRVLESFFRVPHVNVVVVQQVPVQTGVLRVLVGTQVAPESPLTTALELDVPLQVVLEGVRLAAPLALELLTRLLTDA